MCIRDSPNDEVYDWEGQLPTPSITASPTEISSRTGSSTITVSTSLALPASASIEYNLVPLEAGQGVETGWLTYSAPFEVGGPQFPRGFEVIARTVSNSSSHSSSLDSSQTVTTFYQLDPPTIKSSLTSLESTDNLSRQVQVQFENPNPSGSSVVEAQLYNINGDLIRDWFQPGEQPITLGHNFSDGSDIIARTIPTDAFFRQSSDTRRIFDGTFLGAEITGKTIFVLDSSRSMSSDNRLEHLQSSMATILSGFGPENSFAIIDYDATARLVSPWGLATDSRIAEAQTAVANLSATDSGGAVSYTHLTLPTIYSV